MLTLSYSALSYTLNVNITGKISSANVITLNTKFPQTLQFQVIPIELFFWGFSFVFSKCVLSVIQDFKGLNKCLLFRHFCIVFAPFSHGVRIQLSLILQPLIDAYHLCALFLSSPLSLPDSDLLLSRVSVFHILPLGSWISFEDYRYKK